MGSIPVLKPNEVCRVLTGLGFVLVRHAVRMRNTVIADGRQTPVPRHKGRNIAPPLSRQIARDIGLTVDELISHRLMI